MLLSRLQSRYLLIVPFLVVNLLAFLCTYLDVFTGWVDYIFLIHLVFAGVLAAVRKNTVMYKLVTFAVLVGGHSLIGIVLIFSTMFIPGSKEHNYIMYEVCLPAIRKHYGLDTDEPFPNEIVDGEGWGKWWYQHLECEENVRAGNGPIFSENPPGFDPVEPELD